MSTMTNVNITVSITENEGSYQWSFDSSYPGFNNATGALTLQCTGTAQITYQLDAVSAASFNLLYVNLDPGVCATHQIQQVICSGNSIVITDENSAGDTGTAPFSLRLIARKAGEIGAPIVSPDPSVDNDPTNHCP